MQQKSFVACRPAVLAGLLLLAGAAFAQDDERSALYVQGGHNIANGTDTEAAFIGITLPWGPPRPWGETEFTSHWDLFAGQWRGPDLSGAERSYTQLGALATGRWRYDGGNSPWFSDAGLGLAYLDGLYTKPGGRTFSTRLNFALRVGVGRNFGTDGAHEVSVNYQHFSNAGIRRPNPGEDFIQLRYAYRF